MIVWPTLHEWGILRSFYKLPTILVPEKRANVPKFGLIWLFLLSKGQRIKDYRWCTTKKFWSLVRTWAEPNLVWWRQLRFENQTQARIGDGNETAMTRNIDGSRIGKTISGSRYLHIAVIGWELFKAILFTWFPIISFGGHFMHFWNFM